MPSHTEIPDVDSNYDPTLAAWIGRVLAPLNRIWFRYQLRGVELLPPGPCMIAGNHSGIGMADVVCLMGSRSQMPKGRRMVGLMHDLFVSAPIIGWVSRVSGAVRAHPAAARQALGRGYDVVVFPGGGVDSCRPFTQADHVEFGSHRGYARIALETGVPIVPLATTGSHYTYLLLPWIGDAIGKQLRELGWSRDERTPIPIAAVLALVVLAAVLASAMPAWTLALAILVLVIPNPVRVESEMLPPIDVCAATAHLTDPAERVEAAHRLVLGALQRAVRGTPTVEACPRAAASSRFVRPCA
ncbi:MAG: 1-acyl-sn-glycerol-3-phosphate acyltransferase [Myxococcales bacterium]|nr:1-acyl-sn-glycerol-3-phosphate acyltransferase [Myxococcales bacterium]